MRAGLKIIFSLILCSYAPFAFAQESASFHLTKEKVASWYFEENRLTIKMIPQATDEFCSLTRENVAKIMNLYVGNILASSLVISEPICTGSLQMSDVPEMLQKLEDQLPADKKIQQVQ